MFRINRRVDYAVRVVLSLGKRPEGERLPTQTIQAEMQIPRPFLQRIIADLSRAGLVRTFAGPGGGLELGRRSEEINLRQVWEAIEGPLLISDCLKAPGECPLDETCPVRCRWARLQTLIVKELESIGLRDLVEAAALLPAAARPSLEQILFAA